MPGLDLLRAHGLHVDTAQAGAAVPGFKLPGNVLCEEGRGAAAAGRTHLGSCRLLRQMAHVSVTTFHDHTATAFHFFILMNGLLSSNAGSPGLGAAAAADDDDDADDSVGVLAAGASSSEARAEARVVRWRLGGLSAMAGELGRVYQQLETSAAPPYAFLSPPRVLDRRCAVARARLPPGYGLALRHAQTLALTACSSAFGGPREEGREGRGEPQV